MVGAGAFRMGLQDLSEKVRPPAAARRIERPAHTRMSSPIQQRSLSARVCQIVCAAVLGIVLTLGLWPFHAPRNDVSLAGKPERHSLRQV